MAVARLDPGVCPSSTEYKKKVKNTQIWAQPAAPHVAERCSIRARKYLPVTVAYGTCTMPIWLTTTCPETPIVTLWDVLESGNAKNRVNLTCSVCARCGDEVLRGAEMPFSDVCK